MGSALSAPIRLHPLPSARGEVGPVGGGRVSADAAVLRWLVRVGVCGVEGGGQAGQFRQRPSSPMTISMSVFSVRSSGAMMGLLAGGWGGWRSSPAMFGKDGLPKWIVVARWAGSSGSFPGAELTARADSRVLWGPLRTGVEAAGHHGEQSSRTLNSSRNRLLPAQKRQVP